MNAENLPEQPDPAMHDAGLDRLLRADAARDAYIEDGGFTLRVLAALPSPRRQHSFSWLGPALGGLAAAGLAGFSPMASRLLAPFGTMLKGQWMPLHSLLVFVPLIALTYAAAWLAATDTA